MIIDDDIRDLLVEIHKMYNINCGGEFENLYPIVRNWLEENKLVENVICKRTDCVHYNIKYVGYCSHPFVNPTSCDVNKDYKGIK